MGLAANRPDRPSLPVHLAPPTAPDTGSLAEMVQRIRRIGPGSGAAALRELRLAFPDSPLTLRVAALNLLMRQSGPSGYIPR